MHETRRRASEREARQEGESGTAIVAAAGVGQSTNMRVREGEHKDSVKPRLLTLGHQLQLTKQDEQDTPHTRFPHLFRRTS